MILTDTDIARIFRKVYGNPRFMETEKEFARAIEKLILAKQAVAEPLAWALECQSMGGGVSSVLSWSRSGAGVCKRLQGESHEKPLYTHPLVDKPGWKLVPIEPTGAMINAAYNEFNDQWSPTNVSDPDFKQIFEAMLEAAPGDEQ